MQVFVTLVAALPMVAAALPMIVSISAELANRYSHVHVRKQRLIKKRTAGDY